MPDADLYIDRIDIEKYLSTEECRKCGAKSCKDLVERLRGGESADLSALPVHRAGGIGTALGTDGILPVVPSLQHPRPVDAGLFEINEPGPGDPVLVTGNSELTQEVMLAVLSTTTSPFFVLFTDTRGDTLDMAVILKSFTPGRIRKSYEELEVGERCGRGRLVLPGLAEAMGDDIAKAIGREVEVGPVCAAELPLYFGEKWEKE
jgi:CO dehydrogenase/acetyl-CoA synthase gamma subunit (corrinoid Fe-S protein)